MINLLWSAAFMLLLLSGCGWNGTPTRNNDFTPLTSIEISAVSPAIAAGTSTKLSVKGVFLGGQPTGDITDQVVWSSDSPAVASFPYATSPNKNRVTGLIPGTAILTATVGSVSSTFKLTVSSAKATALKITPANPSIAKGLNTQFLVSGTFSDATSQDLTFDSAWTSSDIAVATVSDVVSSKGSVQALAAGTSTITATFDGVSGTTQLTVTAPLLQSIALSRTTLALTTGTSDTITVTATFSDNTTKDVTADADWTSSDVTIATVENSVAANKGRVTAGAAGSATISATYIGKTVLVPATVTVTTRVVQSLSILPNASNITIGNQSTFTATAVYRDDPSKSVDVTKNTIWTINQQNVAILVDSQNQPGVVKGLASGTATLTATFGVNTATATITVP